MAFTMFSGTVFALEFMIRLFCNKGTKLVKYFIGVFGDWNNGFTELTITSAKTQTIFEKKKHRHMNRRKQEAIVREIKPGLFNVNISAASTSYFTVIDATEIFTSDANSAADRNFYKIIHLNNDRVLTNN